MKNLPNILYLSESTNSVNLITPGQGTLAALPTSTSSTTFSILDGDGANNLLSVSIFDNYIQVYQKINGTPSFMPPIQYSLQPNAFLEDCQMWFSIDSINHTIKYGKGEVRNKTTLLEIPFNHPWVKNVNKILIEHLKPIKLFKDPVTFEPPLYVVDPINISLDDVANHLKTTPANLPPICQKLYNTVSGFQLDTPDFPNFSQAIKNSILNPNGWCFKKLKEKANEFGSNNPQETYLRITLGDNFGESPGIPYVMEIWPNNHFSPIHNHAHANAIIKVLHGSITVSLFSRLKNIQPFNITSFNKNDITWISPNLNQFHQLRNTSPAYLQEPCITIQCYMYDNTDHQHYEYFDFLQDNQIKQFNPNSDATFQQFKQIIKYENL